MYILSLSSFASLIFNPFTILMGQGQKFLTWVRPGEPSFVWIWVGKFPPKIPNFSIFFSSDCVGLKNTRIKGGSASYLLWAKSMLGSGRIVVEATVYRAIEWDLLYQRLYPRLVLKCVALDPKLQL